MFGVMLGASLALALLTATATPVSPPEGPQPYTVPVLFGPVAGAGVGRKTITFEPDELHERRVFDVQDGWEHVVRGVSIPELLALVQAPKSVDAAVFVYADGTQIPVRLSDKDEVDGIFIALAQHNGRDGFETTYALHNQDEVACPKVVYSRTLAGASPWRHPTQLEAVRFVTWKLYAPAPPTRRAP